MTKKHRKMDLAVFAVVLSCILFQVIRCGNLPGLYMDAVNPDYAAVQLRWPGLDNEKGMVAFPWLTQVYHGNLAVIPTFISILLTGSTSVLQMHVVYGVIISLCIMLVYLIQRQQGCRPDVCVACALAAATMPMALTMTMTQHYVELPAVLAALCALLCFLKWKADRANEKLLMLSYFLLGLACYGYFNFFFFLPSLLLATVLLCQADKMGAVVRGLICTAAACCCYFIGYTHIALYQNIFSRKLYVILCLLVFMAVFFGMLLLLWRAFTRGSRKRRLTVLAACAVLLLCWAAFVMPYVWQRMLMIEVQGTAASLPERISRLYTLLRNTISGRTGEKLIYKDSVTVLADVPFFLAGLLTLLCAVRAALAREWKKSWLWLLGVMGVYGVCGILFATRMHEQHMIPILFCVIMLIGFEAEEALSGLPLRFGKMTRWLAAALACLLIGLNVLNTSRVVLKIRETGGTQWYTYQINELSERAFENKERGEKELYVFRDWGFLYGFTYLTRNQVKSIWDWNEETIAGYRNQGYDVIVCAWDEPTRDEAHAFLERISGGSGEISVENRLEKSGEVAFYELRLSAQ